MPVPTCDAWSAPEAVSVIQSSRLDEISGIAFPPLPPPPPSGRGAASGIAPDIAWVLEDSGNAADLIALRLSTGEMVARRRITDAAGADLTNVDWEELAIGPCPAAVAWGDAAGDGMAGSGGNAAGDSPVCAWIGDVGDNRAARTDVALIVAPLPDVSGEGGDSFPRRAYILAIQLPIAWPDGPHDTEAMAFSPDGSLHLWSKLRDGTAHGYRLSADQLMQATPGAALTPAPTVSVSVLKDGATPPALPPGSTQPVPWRATAAAWTGEGYVLRTYEAAWLYRPGSDAARTDGAGAPDPARAAVPAPQEPQGEAIAWDGSALWFVSEGIHPTLWRVRCERPGPGQRADRRGQGADP